MAEIKLFNINGNVKEIVGSNALLEKHLQVVIEKNMQKMFGVTFLASEYSTNNSGRMDSLGIDENNCPVIFEYKRAQNENVINQGLFYLDWLLTHKDSFKVLVIETLGIDKANQIDWSMPRVICVAGDFNKYDASAINQMTRNISLIKYKKFGDDLLLFEHINEKVVKPLVDNDDSSAVGKKGSMAKKDYKGFEEYFAQAGSARQELYGKVRDYILSLGDDISETQLKLYVAFKKIKNIVCVQVYQKDITLTLKLDPSTIDWKAYDENFMRDVSNIGHWATGNVEVYIKSENDLEIVKPLIERAYKEN